MEKSRQLYIKVDSEDTAQLAASLDAALTSGWARARDAEERAGKLRNRGGLQSRPISLGAFERCQ